MAYLFFALCFALAGGIVGRLKGYSFFIWFLIAGVVPVLGLLAALLYRTEHDEVRRVGAHRPEGLLAVGCLGHRVAGSSQVGDNHLAHGDVVVDDKHSGHRQHVTVVRVDLTDPQ